jgi:hypothetical protein
MITQRRAQTLSDTVGHRSMPASRETRVRRPRTGIRAAAIAALAAAAVLPAQASAHQTFAFHGIGPGADVATVNNTLDSGGLHEHAVIKVTDKECDGHPVFARYRLSDGELHVVEDSDGCRPRVGQAFAPRGTSIVRYQICEQGHPRPCSPIRKT